MFWIAIVAAFGQQPTERPPRQVGNGMEYSVAPLPRVWAALGYGTDGVVGGLGGSIGLGSTLVAFGEWNGKGARAFFGLGSHALFGDETRRWTLIVIDGDPVKVFRRGGATRHWVRPGLLVGAVHDGTWGFRAQPELSVGRFANVVIGVPVTVLRTGAVDVAVRGGVALGFP